MRIVVEPMELEDISQVLEVDRESYTLPWPASAYRREILHNRNAQYLVLRQILEGDDAPGPSVEPEQRVRLPFFPWRRSDGGDSARTGRILGYAGMWLMVDEAHITTIAMREHWRGKGFGELLLANLIDAATGLGSERVTLEVRVSNEPAQSLYRKYGFRQEGLRTRYYSDNNEDAFIMTTGNIQDAEYSQLFARLVEDLQHRLSRVDDLDVACRVFDKILETQPADGEFRENSGS